MKFGKIKKNVPKYKDPLLQSRAAKISDGEDEAPNFDLKMEISPDSTPSYGVPKGPSWFAQAKSPEKQSDRFRPVSPEGPESPESPVIKPEKISSQPIETEEQFSEVFDTSLELVSNLVTPGDENLVRALSNAQKFKQERQTKDEINKQLPTNGNKYEDHDNFEIDDDDDDFGDKGGSRQKSKKMKQENGSSFDLGLSQLGDPSPELKRKNSMQNSQQSNARNRAQRAPRAPRDRKNSTNSRKNAPNNDNLPVGTQHLLDKWVKKPPAQAESQPIAAKTNNSWGANVAKSQKNGKERFFVISGTDYQTFYGFPIVRFVSDRVREKNNFLGTFPNPSTSGNSL